MHFSSFFVFLNFAKFRDCCVSNHKQTKNKKQKTKNKKQKTKNKNKQTDWNKSTEVARSKFQRMGYNLFGIHEKPELDGVSELSSLTSQNFSYSVSSTMSNDNSEMTSNSSGSSSGSNSSSSTTSSIYNQWLLNMSIHSMRKNLRHCDAIYIGDVDDNGNTFRLLYYLYEFHLISTIRSRVLNDEIPYIGTSVGVNIASLTICTANNNMAIVQPPSLKSLSFLPCQLVINYNDSQENTSIYTKNTTHLQIDQFIKGMCVFVVLIPIDC